MAWAWHVFVFVVGCTPESRNMATNAHTRYNNRAGTLLSNNADDMGAGFNEPFLFFLLLFGAGFGMI
jgi:hypothetical protein